MTPYDWIGLMKSVFCIPGARRFGMINRLTWDLAAESPSIDQ